MRKISHLMLVGAAALATTGLSGQAQAAAFFTSPGPVQPDSNVLFQTASTTGNPVTGALNNSSASVTFSSNESLNVTSSNGQARIGAVDGDLTNLVISLSSGFTFGAIEFNLNALADGTANLIFSGADGITGTGSISANGQNFFSATGNFDTVTINTTSQLADVRQIRITAIATPVGAVPEPATWAMMLAGFGVAGVAMRRRRALARTQAA